MKDENTIIYEIFINNAQFTCIPLEKKKESILTSIIGIPDLEFIEKKTNDGNSIKMYYRLKDILKIKIYKGKKIVIEDNYPLSISLKRLRQLLITKIGDNFFFTINGSIIQIQEEYLFSLKNVIINDELYLSTSLFTFNDSNDLTNNMKDNSKDISINIEDKVERIKSIENINNIIEENNVKNSNSSKDKNDTISDHSQNNDDKVNKDRNNNDIVNKDIINNDKIDNDKINKDTNYNIKISEDNDNNKNNTDSSNNKKEIFNSIKEDKEDSLKNECEFEVVNNDKKICKKKLSPEMSLTNLRDKIEKLIPRRTIFLNNKKKIKPSEEDSITIKNIANNKSIYIEIPEEDKSDTMEIEIHLNGKYYIKKEFYISIKLKTFRNNLKFDETYKIIFKGNPLTIEEENDMTLDELCYKELKVSFIKIKENNNNSINIQNINNILDKRTYKDNFKSNDYYETWILLGKEKSGKTTFINCLVNYCLGVKFEDKFRYIIKEKNKNGYEQYDIKGNFLQTKIRVVEFPGFSGDNDEDESIILNIQKFLKTVRLIKIIGFVISGNQTRLTDEVKIIFSRITEIFGNDIKNNFIFLLTNCDARTPPVLECIKNSIFSKILQHFQNPWYFMFNNSYLFETIQNEFWNLGNSNYDALINNLKGRKNINLEITKKFIDIKCSYKENKINFITCLLQLQNIRSYILILKNIDNYQYLNGNIPFDYTENCKVCSVCNNVIDEYCKNCRSYSIIWKQKKYKQISLKNLKNNKYIYKKCLDRYVNNYRSLLMSTALLYKQLKEYYEYQIINKDTLENDLNDVITSYKDEEQKELFTGIKTQEKLYIDYKKAAHQDNYEKYIISLNYEKIISY